MAEGVSKKLGGGGHEQESYDISTGKYVSDGASSQGQLLSNPLKIKNGFSFDLNGFKASVKEKNNVKIQNFSTVKEAQDYANKLMRSLQENNEYGIPQNDVVKYGKNLNLQSAKEMTEVLQDVSNDFPKLMSNLLFYGNKIEDYSSNVYWSKIPGITSNILNKHLKMYKDDPNSTYQTEHIFDFFSNIYVYVNKSIKSLNHQKYTLAETVGFSGNPDFDFKHKKTMAKKRILDQFMSTQAILLKSEVGEYYSYYETSYNQNISQKFHLPKGNKGHIYATMAHELGHFVNHALDYLHSTKQETYSMLNLYNKVMSDYNLEKTISQYAKTDQSEMVAEAVSDWYCNKENATPINKEIFKYLKEVYNKAYGGK